MQASSVTRGALARVAVRDGRHPYKIGTMVHIGDVANAGAVALVYVVGAPGSGWVDTVCLEAAPEPTAPSCSAEARTVPLFAGGR